ncbi:MAG TPA: PH domain-containing protein [Candidatus Limnocylindrales bacterium]
MAYVDGLLANGERIVRRAHQHWFVMVWNARWAVVAIILAVIGGAVRLLNGGEGIALTLLGWIVLILLVGGIVSFIWGWFVYQNTEFVITNRRIIQTGGVINKQASDSSLEKINDAVLTESLFGRIFGFGDLEVLTASESGIERLHMLMEAVEFKKAMLDAKHELEVDLARPTTPPMRAEVPMPAPVPLEPAPAPAPAAAPAAPSHDATTPEQVADALTRLGGLRDQGLITPEEFEAKKQELLGRL